MRRRQVIERAGIGLSVMLAAIATWLMLQPPTNGSLPKFPHLDKITHFLAFFLIVLPAVTVRPRSWVWIVLAASALGGAIEIIQPFFGRDRELGDFVADMLGALTAVPVGLWVSKRWQLYQWKRSQKQP